MSTKKTWKQNSTDCSDSTRNSNTHRGIKQSIHRLKERLQIQVTCRLKTWKSDHINCYDIKAQLITSYTNKLIAIAARHRRGLQNYHLQTDVFLSSKHFDCSTRIICAKWPSCYAVIIYETLVSFFTICIYFFLSCNSCQLSNLSCNTITSFKNINNNAMWPITSSDVPRDLLPGLWLVIVRIAYRCWHYTTVMRIDTALPKLGQWCDVSWPRLLIIWGTRLFAPYKLSYLLSSSSPLWDIRRSLAILSSPGDSHCLYILFESVLPGLLWSYLF